MGKLFDLPHLLYIAVSLSVTGVLLVLAKKALDTPKRKDRFLQTFGALTFFLHISILWVDFLRDGSASVPDNILFPKYFCNFCMYMLMIVAFWGNKRSRTFQAVAIFTAYGGFFGAMISLIYPEYYLGAASIWEWAVFKSMLSHSTMLLGCIWILLGGYVPVRRTNALVFLGGLGAAGILGLLLNGLFALFGLPAPNAMYLQHPPLEEVPFFSCWTIAALMVLVVWGFTALYEHLAKVGPKKGEKPVWFWPVSRFPAGKEGLAWKD